jgi:peptidoglycan hydrolase-like protein with peptidoglycan-binding domain
MMRQLQHNLADGGYYSGPIDGHLTARTRAALADFQREYHLHSHSGALDKTTADALLGRDQVLAATTHTPVL